VPVPPQHTDGQLLLNSTGAASVPVIRLQLTGVTLVNATIGIFAVGTPAPVTSHATVAAVVTTLPGRLSGMPVSSENPAQIVVVSFGKNPHPRMFNGTVQIELMIPVVVGVVTNVPGTTARHMSCGTQLIPWKQILPRFRSLCLIGVHSAASLPSILRSKHGVGSVISPAAPTVASFPQLNNSKMVGSV